MHQYFKQKNLQFSLWCVCFSRDSLSSLETRDQTDPGQCQSTLALGTEPGRRGTTRESPCVPQEGSFGFVERTLGSLSLLSGIRSRLRPVSEKPERMRYNSLSPFCCLLLGTVSGVTASWQKGQARPPLSESGRHLAPLPGGVRRLVGASEAGAPPCGPLPASALSLSPPPPTPPPPSLHSPATRLLLSLVGHQGNIQRDFRTWLCTHTPR